MKDLTGKVVLVTGASRGIGKGTALSLGKAGAKVYITGRTEKQSDAAVDLPGTIHETAEEITSQGGHCVAIRCDHGTRPETACYCRCFALPGISANGKCDEVSRAL